MNNTIVILERHHEMAEVGRDLKRLPSPIPQLQVTHPTPARVGCSGPCPDGFWLSPRLETSEPIWALSSRTQFLLQQISIFLFLNVISYISGNTSRVRSLKQQLN